MMDKTTLCKWWLSAFFAVCATGAFSQMVVDSKTADFLRKFDDQKVKPAHIDTSYWAVPKHIEIGMAARSVSNNWYQTDNRSSLAVNAKILINANYIREYTRWNNTLDIRLGFLWEDAGKLADGARNLTVSENYLRLETQYGVKLVRRFDFAANAKLETQIMPSYAKNTSDKPNKTFMAPGTLNIGLGATYNYSNERLPKLSVSFFPINNNTTLVLNQRLADAGTSGVEPAEKDADGNIIRHGKQSKMAWGVRTQCYVKYFLLENKKFWVSNDFAIFIDYVENFGAGQMDNKTSFSYAISKNMAVGYDITLRYYDNEKVTKLNPATGKNEQYPAGLQMVNNMSFKFVFDF